MTTVESGSKGDHLNIAQITSLLGQQITEGQRVKPLLSNGRRTLPHYILKEENNDTEHFHDLLEEYESQGFISSSFAQGLNPKEFFFIVWQEDKVCVILQCHSNKWLYYEEKCQTNRRY